ncbi:MAG: mannose-6-phosphate isomerase, class I, partial [Bifidobacteriaceae bacterium]|nr:mannose-6-phosphate isomerase, class I [Bifidobacteriaceae bacterium]
MLRLDHVVKDYPWGSVDQVPRLLGFAPPGGPVAEIWLGAHRTASALVARGQADAGTPLRDVIARDPSAHLGPGWAELPFLLKVLGVAAPLSLQVHPGAGRARAGFAREEAAGVPIDAPNRTYKDPNAKPEMVYALDSFELLAGFRRPAEIRAALEPLAAASTLAAALAAALAPAAPRGRPGGLRQAVEIALTGPEAGAGELAEFIAACRRQAAAAGANPDPHALPVALAERYPADRALAVAMMMNHVHLAPGQALYLPPGTLHAYLRGLAVEVLGASDNVLRAGLTSKHSDPAAVVATIDWDGPGALAPSAAREGAVLAL